MPRCRNSDSLYYRGHEPSPKGLGWCSQTLKIGTQKKGRDGALWEVIRTQTGQRWQRTSQVLAQGKRRVKRRVSRSPRRKKSRRSPSSRSKSGQPKTIKYSFQALDTNRDGYISIDEYLAQHQSLGPEATPGRINYHYQDWGNFMRFFLKMMKQEKKLKLVCLPPVMAAMKKFPQERYRSAMMIYLRERSYVLPPTIFQAIKNCRRKGIRFIAISLMVFPHERTGVGHQNIMIIDLKKETLERFDPYGQTTTFRQDEDQIITQIIQKHLITPLNKQFPDLNFKFLPPKLISPFLGPQERGDAYCGMCVTFAMMYLHLRVLNPDLSQKTVIQKMMRGGKKGIQTRVLRYARYIEEVLKSKR